MNNSHGIQVKWGTEDCRLRCSLRESNTEKVRNCHFKRTRRIRANNLVRPGAIDVPLVRERLPRARGEQRRLNKPIDLRNDIGQVR